MTKLTTIPKTITAGDSVELRLAAGLHPPADGWALRIDLAGPEKPAPWLSVNDGGVHSFAIAATTTGTYAAGHYAYQLSAVAEGKRVTLERGTLEVRPDLAGIDGAYEARSWAQATLDAVEATLARKATADQLSVSIAGRSLARYPFADLMALRDKLVLQIARASGKGRSKNIHVRFGGR